MAVHEDLRQELERKVGEGGQSHDDESQRAPCWMRLTISVLEDRRRLIETVAQAADVVVSPHVLSHPKESKTLSSPVPKKFARAEFDAERARCAKQQKRRQDRREVTHCRLLNERPPVCTHYRRHHH